MTIIRYENGRLYINNRDPWGNHKSVEFNPKDLEPEYKAMMMQAVEEMTEES